MESESAASESAATESAASESVCQSQFFLWDMPARRPLNILKNEMYTYHMFYIFIKVRVAGSFSDILPELAGPEIYLFCTDRAVKLAS